MFPTMRQKKTTFFGGKNEVQNEAMMKHKTTLMTFWAKHLEAHWAPLLPAMTYTILTTTVQ